MAVADIFAKQLSFGFVHSFQTNSTNIQLENSTLLVLDENIQAIHKASEKVIVLHAGGGSAAAVFGLTKQVQGDGQLFKDKLNRWWIEKDSPNDFQLVFIQDHLVQNDQRFANQFKAGDWVHYEAVNIAQEEHKHKLFALGVEFLSRSPAVVCNEVSKRMPLPSFLNEAKLPQSSPKNFRAIIYDTTNCNSGSHPNVRAWAPELGRIICYNTNEPTVGKWLHVTGYRRLVEYDDYMAFEAEQTNLIKPPLFELKAHGWGPADFMVADCPCVFVAHCDQTAVAWNDNIGWLYMDEERTQDLRRLALEPFQMFHARLQPIQKDENCYDRHFCWKVAAIEEEHEDDEDEDEEEQRDETELLLELGTKCQTESDCKAFCKALKYHLNELVELELDLQDVENKLQHNGHCMHV